jgi:ferredoxin
MQLKVDTAWCSKCKICRAVSGGRIQFRDDGYPAEGKIADGDLEQIEAAVAYCPIGALSLSGD